MCIRDRVWVFHWFFFSLDAGNWRTNHNLHCTAATTDLLGRTMRMNPVKEMVMFLCSSRLLKQTSSCSSGTRAVPLNAYASLKLGCAYIHSSWIHVTSGFYCTRGTFKLPVLELDHRRKTFNYFYFYCQHLTIAMIILFLLSKITIIFSHQVAATRISSTRTHSKRHFYFSASLFWSWAMK